MFKYVTMFKMLQIKRKLFDQSIYFEGKEIFFRANEKGYVKVVTIYVYKKVKAELKVGHKLSC